MERGGDGYPQCRCNGVASWVKSHPIGARDNPRRRLGARFTSQQRTDKWRAKPDRTRIEFRNGPHTFNGVGTFGLLRKRLRPSA